MQVKVYRSVIDRFQITRFHNANKTTKRRHKKTHEHTEGFFAVLFSGHKEAFAILACSPVHPLVVLFAAICSTWVPHEILQSQSKSELTSLRDFSRTNGMLITDKWQMFILCVCKTNILLWLWIRRMNSFIYLLWIRHQIFACISKSLTSHAYREKKRVTFQVVSYQLLQFLKYTLVVIMECK